MSLPRLKTRPQSVHTCTSFRGLDRRPGASSRSRNNTWNWHWHDERNLSADRYPRLSVRNGRTQVMQIDKNTPVDDIVAMCGGDHVVLLDKAGWLWCNGHSVDMNGTYDKVIYWEMTHDNCKIAPTITPKSGNTIYPSTLGGLCNTDHAKTVTFRIKETHSAGSPGAVYIDEWETDATGTWTDVSPADLHDVYGITFSYNSAGGFYLGWSFYVNLDVQSEVAQGSPRLIRMGSDVVICYGGTPIYWCNAVKLASGAAMTAGTDYGRIECAVGVYLSAYETTLTLCDIDGNAYSGVVVSATEPTQEGYWLDTSGDKPALQEWSVSQSMWVKLTSTYVKIEGIPLIGTQPLYSSPLKKGDVANFKVTDLDVSTDPLVVELLNSAHYLYDAGNGPVLSEPYMIVAGILPSDTVTVNTGYAEITREPPVMDFIVEAQNRLWGCRYDEANSINEIYASKLGDYRNWEVYQGLSTDSWRASRGTAAPFTGAITLGGYPLFFREESLEKVFPSSSGSHQIAVYALDGVQKGSADSMVIIDERLFYKSRLGVCMYAGTLPYRISDEFGDWHFSNASAGRQEKKYVASMDRSDGERLCAVYDTSTGDWHMESADFSGITVTWNDNLYYTERGKIYKFDGGSPDGIEWFAESDELAMELPEHKWITYVRIRFKLDLKAECRLYAAYDSGEWERKAALHGNHMGTREVTIWPRRCDHFRLRLEGTGGCEIQSISYRVERSEGGH